MPSLAVAPDHPGGPLRVLVAGGGVAGLETLLALRHLAGDRIERTLLTPEAEFVYRPMAVAEPFSRGHAQRHRLDEIAKDLGARLVRGSLAEVDDRTRTAVTGTGERLSYDVLVVAIGAGSEPALRRALTWTPESDDEVYGGLLRDLEEGYPKRVAFVIPPGVAWPLPGYELALMTAWDAQGMGMDDLEITVYTPESAPLELFGAAAGQALREDLDDVGVQVRTGAYVSETATGDLVVAPGGRPLEADRVVALPRAVGPALPGVLNDARGFIRCDRHGKVYDTASVWAAGDAIAFPVKQGGLAAQQADAVADDIAARAGMDVRPQPFRPVLRGVLLTGRGQAWMRNAPAGGDGEGEAQRRALFWPPTKIAGRYLSPYLAERDRAQAVGEVPQPSGQPVELDLERDLPAAADALHAAEPGVTALRSGPTTLGVT
jgi:sulfide:quinone oxidoreductase